MPKYCGVNNVPKRVNFPRDPNDADTINLAIERKADFIVSRDADLLDLNDDPTFRHLCPNTRVVDPIEFMREIERRRELEQDRAQVREPALETEPSRTAKRDRGFGMER